MASRLSGILLAAVMFIETDPRVLRIQDDFLFAGEGIWYDLDHSKGCSLKIHPCAVTCIDIIGRTALWGCFCYLLLDF